MEQLINQLFKASKKFGCEVTSIHQADARKVVATCNYGGTPFIVTHTPSTEPEDVILLLEEAYKKVNIMFRGEAKG